MARNKKALKFAWNSRAFWLSRTKRDRVGNYLRLANGSTLR